MIIRYSRKNKRDEKYTGMGSVHIERRGSLKYALLSMWVLTSLGMHICTLYKLEGRNMCCSNSAPALPAVHLQEEGMRKSVVEEKKRAEAGEAAKNAMQAGYIARKEYEKEIQKPRNVKKAVKAAGAVYKLKKDEMACVCRIRMRLIDAHAKKRREVDRAQKVISKYYLSNRPSMLPGVCTIYDIQKETADALLYEIEELERSERAAASEHTQQKIRHYRVLSTLQDTRQRNINYLESLLELQQAFSVSIERHTAHLKAKLARERALYALRKIEESCALVIEEDDPLRTAIAAHAKSIQDMSESIALLDRIYDIQQDIIFKIASSKPVYAAQNTAASEHERQERGLRKARKTLCSAKNV